ncbi:MAG: glycosyltransferase family 39 protein [Caldilineaceae bacterium]
MDKTTATFATPRQSNRWQRPLLLSGLLVAFALRLFHLGAESLWYDETVSVVLARKTVTALIAHTARDIHPPGYYLLLHGWQGLTQPTLAHGLEFLYAWPSLWFGLLIIALLYPLARRFDQRATALLTVWLAALNPFQLWYSQEVRMYTLGAALGLLCLWALVKYLDESLTKDERPTTNDLHVGRSSLVVRPSSFVYAISAALGLYTLYYFLFLLVALNLLAFGVLWQQRKTQARRVGRALFPWLAAQALTGLLYLPWLPILWRQATEPPVPGWRTPWQTWPAFLQSLSESLAALLVGQSPPGSMLWPWALLVVVVLVLFLYTKTTQTTGKVQGEAALEKTSPIFSNLLLLSVLLPILLIYLVTLTVTPLYHVRYLFTYASPFLVIVAQVLWRLRRWQRWLGALAITGVVLVSSAGLAEFWFNPLYRTDDHRAAVAQLAAQWRPGDLILVNAGWVYTVVETYWPNELTSPAAALPPPLAQPDRLTTYAEQLNTAPNPDQVKLVITGSVNGAASLGWGQPDSDFYAMPDQAGIEALAKLSDVHTRLWHYRLYDTVGDPQGVLRQWLDAHAQLVSDTPFPGRDYLRVQLYEPYTIKSPDPAAKQNHQVFGGLLQLTDTLVQPEVTAGETFYLPTHWAALPGGQKLPAVSLSLRLYTKEGRLLAQQDAAPLQATNIWQPNQTHALPLALPIPLATTPGDYTLVLVVYAQQNGAPLPTPGADTASGGITLGHVKVQAAKTMLHEPTALARFDYIDLLTAQLAKPQLRPGEPLDLRLVWWPRPNAYRDTYLATLALHNAQGDVVQSWEAALGGWDYPSGQWPPAIPVQDWRQMVLAPNTPAGVYQVTLQVARSSDKQVIPARQGWWPRSQATLTLGQLTITGQ